MNHEVYICYDDNDTITADAICHVLEDNKIKCWFKTRDLGVNHMVDEIMEAIKQSKVMVLIFSDHSKNSNFVNTEVDIAFTENIPILVFKIDESTLDGSLEFFLNNKHWLDAYPNPEVEFENLIVDTSKIIGKPIKDPLISNKASPQPKKSISKRRVQRTTASKPKEKQSSSFFSKYKIPIIVVAVALVAIVGVMALMSSGGLGSPTPEYTINLEGIDMDDDRDTDYSWNYSFFIFGTIAPAPEGDMIVHSDFYDASGKVIDTDDTKYGEVEGDILGLGVSGSDDIVKVSVELRDASGKVLAQAETTRFIDI